MIFFYGEGIHKTPLICRLDLLIMCISLENEFQNSITGLILGLHPANERRRYKVTASLIGWIQTQKQPCYYAAILFAVWESVQEWEPCMAVPGGISLPVIWGVHWCVWKYSVYTYIYLYIFVLYNT